MAERHALLIDGGFRSKRLRARLQRPVAVEDVLQACAAIHAHPHLAGLQLLRIYYYDAPPATGKLVHPIDGRPTNLGRTPQHEAATRFHDELENSADVALRMGELILRGWRVKAGSLEDIGPTGRALAPADLEPNLQQKGVDLRIGLDIARLSLRSLVGTIVVVTGDADMVPAFKFARREGVRVFVDVMGAPVRGGLIAHADRVL